MVVGGRHDGHAVDRADRFLGQALEALEEAIQVTRLMWSGQRGLRFDGKYYRLNGAHAGPQPAHQIQIWIGAIGPRMLALTGRLGDGWVPSSSYVPPGDLAEKNALIDAAAREAGRDPGKIRRIYNLLGTITAGERGGYLEGPPEYWAGELARLAREDGMDTFIFAPQQPSEAQIRLFAEQVVARVIA